MESELLDIVDENNEPLHIAKERSAVHTDGDWHRSVHIYVLDGADNLLIHLRSPFKDLSPNCWDTKFGGHVVAGDTVENTAMRELEEEVGIKKSFEKFIKGPTIKYDGGKNKEFNPSYYYKFQKEDTIKFNDQEATAVKWIPIEDTLKSSRDDSHKWTDHTKVAMQEIYDFWKKLKH